MPPPGSAAAATVVTPNDAADNMLFSKWQSMTRTLAHYELGEQIGEGTYGQVYRGVCKDSGQVVALKKMRLHHGGYWGMPLQLVREIKILKRLHHPNLLSLQEVVTSKGVEHLDPDDPPLPKHDPNSSKNKKALSKSSSKAMSETESKQAAAREAYKGNLFLVLEYVTHDLTGLIDVGYAFAPVQIKCIVRQLLEALAYMHQQKYLHRDIKSSNILLDNNFRLKLADFGLARSTEPPLLSQLQPETTAAGGDMTNKVITLWYRPPEILAGAVQYGPAVDVWSAGCILAELCLGKPLFAGKTELDQWNRIVDTVGTPTANCWQHLQSLRAVPSTKRSSDLATVTIDLTKPPKPSRLPTKYQHKIPAAALTLLEKLLEWDPRKRLTCAHALESRYFWTAPVAPDDPAALGTVLEPGIHFHEFQTKKVRKQAKAAAEQARDAMLEQGASPEAAKAQLDAVYQQWMQQVAQHGLAPPPQQQQREFKSAVEAAEAPRRKEESQPPGGGRHGSKGDGGSRQEINKRDGHPMGDNDDEQRRKRRRGTDEEPTRRDRDARMEDIIARERGGRPSDERDQRMGDRGRGGLRHNERRGDEKDESMGDRGWQGPRHSERPGGIDHRMEDRGREGPRRGDRVDHRMAVWGREGPRQNDRRPDEIDHRMREGGREGPGRHDRSFDEMDHMMGNRGREGPRSHNSMDRRMGDREREGPRRNDRRPNEMDHRTRDQDRGPNEMDRRMRDQDRGWEGPRRPVAANYRMGDQDRHSEGIRSGGLHPDKAGHRMEGQGRGRDEHRNEDRRSDGMADRGEMARRNERPPSGKDDLVEGAQRERERDSRNEAVREGEEKRRKRDRSSERGSKGHRRHRSKEKRRSRSDRKGERRDRDHRDRHRDRESERHRDREQGSERSRDSGRGSERHRDSERGSASRRHRDPDRHRDRHRDRDRERGNDRGMGLDEPNYYGPGDDGRHDGPGPMPANRDGPPTGDHYGPPDASRRGGARGGGKDGGRYHDRPRDRHRGQGGGRDRR